MRQSNNVGLQFSQLPQKRRWRKPGLVERRRNDFQKLNRYSCVRNICFWGSLEARRGLRRIKHLRGFSWRGFLIRSRNGSNTCIDICPNCHWTSSYSRCDPKVSKGPAPGLPMIFIHQSGIRNANDNSMRLVLTVGCRVWALSHGAQMFILLTGNILNSLGH